MFNSNTDQIKKLMRKDLKLKKQIQRNRREDSYDTNVQEWKSQGGSVGKMSKDTHWGFSPTSRSSVRPFKPQPKRLSEGYGYGFPRPLGDIIDEYKEWEELEEIIRELESE